MKAITFTNKVTTALAIFLAIFLLSYNSRSVQAAAGGTRTLVYLTSGTSWSVPSDWNSANNTIEVIGGGGGGGCANPGGGGAYSKTTNVSLTPSASVTYAVGSGGSGGGWCGAGGTGGDTYFCNSTSNCASIAGSAVVVGAKGGGGAGTGQNSASAGVGGSSASGVGTTKYSGGSTLSYYSAGGGGGGAAGPNGAGVASAGTNGGNGGGGLGGSGGKNATAGTAGTEWDSTHGSGGGGGFTVTGTGGAGALYGGGGGAGAPGYTGGAGAAGIIVITYYSSGGITFAGNVKFSFNLLATGAFSKGAGSFAIDHPLDPFNKILYHSYVESPDVKNIYNGTVRLNALGEATIVLPSYWEALNKTARYQFTSLDGPMPDLYLKSEVKNNAFIIAGGEAFKRVSWQVTGIRHDPYIQKHPITVEVPKTGEPVSKGECLFEPLCE